MIVKYDLVIFDMDGTVLDTLEDLLGAMNYALARQQLGSRTLDEMRSYVGNGLYMMAVRACGVGAPMTQVDAVFNDFKAWYSEHLNVKTHPYEGITALLKRMKARGIKAGICSNKFDPGAKALAQAHFGDLIDLTVGESEQVPKKPDPASTKLILSRLNVRPERALYVGDSAVDVQTAKAAGLELAAVSWGFASAQSLKQAGAKRIFDTVGALEEYILR